MKTDTNQRSRCGLFKKRKKKKVPNSLEAGKQSSILHVIWRFHGCNCAEIPTQVLRLAAQTRATHAEVQQRNWCCLSWSKKKNEREREREKKHRVVEFRLQAAIWLLNSFFFFAVRIKSSYHRKQTNQAHVRSELPASQRTVNQQQQPFAVQTRQGDSAEVASLLPADWLTLWRFSLRFRFAPCGGKSCWGRCDCGSWCELNWGTEFALRRVARPQTHTHTHTRRERRARTERTSTLLKQTLASLFSGFLLLRNPAAHRNISFSLSTICPFYCDLNGTVFSLTCTVV